MRSEYDFTQSRQNPYANQLKRQITIRLDTTSVTYFKDLALELVSVGVLTGLRKIVFTSHRSLQ